MTSQEKIIQWLENLPTKQQIEKEAGLPQGYLTKDFKWRKETIEKIEKVVKKYGFR